MEKKKLYEGQKHSIYELQKILGVSHYCLYNYIDKPEMVKNMSMKLLFGIAQAEQVEANHLWEMMKEYADKKIKERNEK